MVNYLTRRGIAGARTGVVALEGARAVAPRQPAVAVLGHRLQRAVQPVIRSLPLEKS